MFLHFSQAQVTIHGVKNVVTQSIQVKVMNMNKKDQINHLILLHDVYQHHQHVQFACHHQKMNQEHQYLSNKKIIKIK